MSSLQMTLRKACSDTEIFLAKRGIEPGTSSTTGMCAITTELTHSPIWAQTVCKGYQQMTKAAASKKRVKHKENSVSFAGMTLGLRLGLRMDFLLCPILRPNILGHILFK